MSKESFNINRIKGKVFSIGCKLMLHHLIFIRPQNVEMF